MNKMLVILGLFLVCGCSEREMQKLTKDPALATQSDIASVKAEIKALRSDVAELKNLLKLRVE